MKYDPNLILWFVVDPHRVTEKLIEKMEKNKEKWIKEGLNENSDGLWMRAHNEVEKEFSPEDMNKYQLDLLNKMNDLYKGQLIFLHQQGVQFPYVYDFASTRENIQIHQIVNLQENTSLHFPTDVHPNIEGHRAIAEDVFQYLTKNKLIPCE